MPCCLLTVAWFFPRLALIIMYFANLWFGVSIGGLMDPEYLSEGWSLLYFRAVNSPVCCDCAG